MTVKRNDPREEQSNLPSPLSPPRVPKWTLELARDRAQQILKKELLRFRGILYRVRVKSSADAPDLRRCRRILVLRTDRLGDVVLTVPFVQALKTVAPWAELIYAVRTPWVSLFQGQKNVDQVIGLPSSFREQVHKIVSTHSDLIIDTRVDPVMETAMLCHRSGAKWRVGFAGYGRECFFTSYRNPPEDGRHFSDQAFDLLKLWPGLKVGRIASPFLTMACSAGGWWEDQLAKNSVLASSYVCVHPGAFYETQRWPLDYFVSLSEKIRKDLNLPVIWCSGAETRPPSLGHARETLCFSNLTIDQLSAVLAHAKVFVGNISGPLHLACSMGVPTVSLMGPTVPHRWWPLGNGHQVVRLGVECSPCNLGWCSHHTCLRAISVEQVLKLVASCLEIEN